MTPLSAAEKRRAFCARLKGERERRDTSLTAIATSTKIKASLLEALERADLSKWPKGLYRRAFFRDYVVAIGLAPDPLVREFLEVFSDGEPRLVNGTATPSQDPPAFRLMLGDGRAYIRPSAVADRPSDARMKAAAIDLAAIAAVSWLIHAILPVQGTTIALVLVTLFYGATAWFGKSPSEFLLQRLRRPQTASPGVPSTLPYNAQTPARSYVTSVWSERFGESLFGPSVLRSYWERTSGSVTLMFHSKRRRDLEAVRRQRIQAASRAPVDDVSVSSHVAT